MSIYAQSVVDARLNRISRLFDNVSNVLRDTENYLTSRGLQAVESVTQAAQPIIDTYVQPTIVEPVVESTVVEPQVPLDFNFGTPAVEPVAQSKGSYVPDSSKSLDNLDIDSIINGISFDDVGLQP